MHNGAFLVLFISNDGKWWTSFSLALLFCSLTWTRKEKCAASISRTKRRRAGRASQSRGKWWKIEAAIKKNLKKKETRAGTCAGVLWSAGLYVLARSLQGGAELVVWPRQLGLGSWSRSRGRKRTVSTIKWQPEVKKKNRTAQREVIWLFAWVSPSPCVCAEKLAGSSELGVHTVYIWLSLNRPMEKRY